MTRRRKIVLFGLLPLGSFLLALIIIGLVGFVQGPRNKLGEKTVSILQGATQVETFRLVDGPYDDYAKAGTTSDEIIDYPVHSQGQVFGRKFAANLAHAVLDPRTYAAMNDNTCEINPDVAFRAWRGRECVEVILCYHCHQMLVTTKDAQGHMTHSAYTEFYLNKPAFLALAKEVFPGDKEIQSLQ